MPGSKSNRPRTSIEAQDVARTYCDPDKLSRGPQLAAFELECRLAATTEKRKQAFLDHFERYSTSEFIVNDLERNLAVIDNATFQSIRATIAQTVKPEEAVLMVDKVVGSYTSSGHVH